MPWILERATIFIGKDLSLASSVAGFSPQSIADAEERQEGKTYACSISLPSSLEPKAVILSRAQRAYNTLAVLGPASNQHSEWRTNAVALRNQATVQGNRNLAALLEAVIGLLDAGGNPAGLGQGMQGIYARTWKAILKASGS